MKLLASTACLLLFTLPTAAETPAAGFAELDYSTLERSIAKEPEYVAEPRYALFVLDPAGEFRVWAAFDKSSSDLDYYDVVYFDMNGDGDLTETGERFVGTYDERRAAAGTSVTIKIGDVPVPGTGLVHTDLMFATVPKKGRKGYWFRMKWNGTEEVSGGYAKVGIDTTVYPPTIQDAPILRPTPLGPLSFAFWEHGPVTLPIGGSKQVNLVIGNEGSGPDTLCSLSEHFLTLKLDTIVATLIAKDEVGNEIRSRNLIKKHC